MDGRWIQEAEAKVQKRPSGQNGSLGHHQSSAHSSAPPDSGPARNGKSLIRENGSKSSHERVTNGGDSTEDQEKDERRRAAQRVFNKQG